MTRQPDPRPRAIATVLGDKPSKTYGNGERRVCAADTCDTVLSRYNPGPGCGRHQELNRRRTRGVRTPK